MQPVEKLSYGENSTVRFNSIKRFETELKSLQSASPLGFNDNIYHEGNISKSKKGCKDQELKQSEPNSSPQNQNGK